MLKTFHTASLSFALALFMSSSAFAEGEAHASGGGGLPQFDPTSWPSQLFWLAVFFIVLYFVFGKSVIPSLGKTIDDRESYINDHIQKAEKISNEAEILRAEIDKGIKDANHKASVNITEVETAAKSKLSSALSDFRVRYEQKVEQTENRIETAKTAAMADMEKIVVNLAGQAAEKIAGIPASESGAETIVKSLTQKPSQAA